jgi:hypothetical protein
MFYSLKWSDLNHGNIFALISLLWIEEVCAAVSTKESHISGTRKRGKVIRQEIGDARGQVFGCSSAS